MVEKVVISGSVIGHNATAIMFQPDTEEAAGYPELLWFESEKALTDKALRLQRLSHNRVKLSIEGFAPKGEPYAGKLVEVAAFSR